MSKGSQIYKHIMTGVSYFLPFVIAGGMLMSLAFLIDAGNVGTKTYGSTIPLAAWLLETGKIAFSLMLPILAGFVAFSIADRPGILPGIVAGMVAQSGGSGFIGAILGGFVAGYIIYLLKKLTSNIPRTFEATKTLIIFPVIGLLLTAGVMIAVNAVVEPLNQFLTGALKDLSGTSSILLGAVIGGMLAFDMGGPVNKTAYLFSVASLTGADGSATSSIVMAAAACSGMTISMSCALATTLFPKKFNDNLKGAGKAAYVMGASYIAEGAIPFVIAKPKQILPSIITGAAVAGALVSAFGVKMSAPIGGIFTIPLTSNIPLYILSFIIGTLVSTLMIGFLTKKEEPVEQT
ncbi:PTS system, fructose subfamily, IIC component [Seinonella peptonophila]|uniref:PTS system, fructose subfamily, IIC component n=1 Tax=Seinonella peptonophila TaxID=112248 RepID=A0A1M4ZTC6_9BACL|nr:fructose-specific PTS transporter subunit EIIC [Seinonella peptonophila]SHF21087.1 PTS system, fructose subfamily, IIC component [Seinonella peptonophila]